MGKASRHKKRQQSAKRRRNHRDILHRQTQDAQKARRDRELNAERVKRENEARKVRLAKAWSWLSGVGAHFEVIHTLGDCLHETVFFVGRSHDADLAFASVKGPALVHLDQQWWAGCLQQLQRKLITNEGNPLGKSTFRFNHEGETILFLVGRVQKDMDGSRLSASAMSTVLEFSLLGFNGAGLSRRLYPAESPCLNQFTEPTDEDPTIDLFWLVPFTHGERLPSRR